MDYNTQAATPRAASLSPIEMSLNGHEAQVARLEQLRNTLRISRVANDFADILDCLEI